MISLLRRDITHWVKDGFNASLITYGEEGAGKTAALFGFDQSDNSPGSKKRMEDDTDKERTRPGVALSVLREIFTDSQQYDVNSLHNSSNNGGGNITIALSAWILQGQQIVE